MRYQRPSLTTIQFENDPGATPLVGFNPVNIYLDIFFKGWEVFDFGVAGSTANVPGVLPQSPPVLIGYGTLDAATVEQGTPALTVIYQDTTVDHFDFNSFFFGCALDTVEGAASAPQTCTVTVTGFDKNNKQVAQQKFNFVQDGLSQQMVQAKLVGFTNLQTATFSTASTLLGTLPVNTTVSTVADTFNYTVYGQNPVIDRRAFELPL